MARLRNTLLIFLLIHASGCGSEIEFELYNHSGASVTINNCEGDQFIAAGEPGVVYGCRPPGLAMLSKERKWSYATLPSNFAESGYVRKIRLRPKGRLKVQLEPDGSIIAMKPADDPPVRSDYPQPPGFPIRPDGVELLR